MVNREALWEVLRMYDVGGKLLNGIKSMYVHISACVRVKGGDWVVQNRYWGETGVYHVPLTVQCIYGWSNKGVEDGVGKKGSELLGGWERVEIA